MESKSFRAGQIAGAVAALVFAVVGILYFANAGNSDPGCDEPVGQKIDPLSSQHLLPGQPEPTYLTNPPTSGAHRPGPLPADVLDEPLAKPDQVNLLEAGRVLIQYRPSVERAQLRKLASSVVTVAPGVDLPAPIVATAWLSSVRCERFDKSALESFIGAHAGKVDGH